MAQVKVVMKQRQLNANGEDHRQRPHTNDSFCFEEKRLEDWMFTAFADWNDAKSSTSGGGVKNNTKFMDLEKNVPCPRYIYQRLLGQSPMTILVLRMRRQ